jgi:hypothetical protein
MNGLWGKTMADCLPAQGPALVSFEVVASETDFFISVNDGLLPSKCVEFSVGANDCMEFLMDDGTTVYSWPLPGNSRRVVAERDKVLFVRFENGAPCDAKELSQVQREATSCQ